MIDTLCAQLQGTTAHGSPQVTTWQFSEKLGGLRFHVRRPDPFQHGMIKLAEAMSLGICDLCGNRGKLRGLDGVTGCGWMRTQCDEHANTQPAGVTHDRGSIDREASEKCPLMQAKRAGQKRDRELVESGQCTLESMFFISPEIVRKVIIKRRTDDF